MGSHQSVTWCSPSWRRCCPRWPPRYCRRPPGRPSWPSSPPATRPTFSGPSWREYIWHFWRNTIVNFGKIQLSLLKKYNRHFCRNTILTSREIQFSLLKKYNFQAQRNTICLWHLTVSSCCSRSGKWYSVDLCTSEPSSPSIPETLWRRGLVETLFSSNCST